VITGPVVWGTGAGAQIWNPDFAFQHVHLATSASGEVGVSVAAGGGANDATPLAGFVGDSTLYA